MRMIYDNILTWNKSFDRHGLEVMAGTSATTSVWEQLSGSRSYFSSTNNNAIPNLNGGNNGGVRGQSYGKSEWSIMSYLPRRRFLEAGSRPPLGLLPLVLGRVAYLGREVPARRVVDQRPERARRLGTDR